jgi:phosphinothricin acetyltransferase
MPTVRPALEADLPAMLDIYNDIILHTTAVYSYDPHTLDMRKAWFEEKQATGNPVFVATEGAQIVGFSSYGPFRPWAAYQFTVENSVYVKAEERGKGIGKLLIPPLIRHAREKGLHVMIASIDASNEASLNLHRSFGFKQVAHFREVGFKFDRWLDLTFLELILYTIK